MITPQLDVGFEVSGGLAALEAQLRGGAGQGSLFLCSLGGNAFDPAQAFVLGYGVQDQRGFEVYSQQIGDLELLPSGLKLHFSAVSLDAGRVVRSNDEQLWINPRFGFELDFDYAVGGVSTQAGEIVDEQYSVLGVHVSAKTFAPGAASLAVLMSSPFASEGKGGGRVNSSRNTTSSRSKGVGPGLHEMRMVVAANDDDVAPQDGLIDSPSAESAGGFLQFDFDTPFDVHGLEVADVPVGESVTFEGFDGAGRLVDRLVAPGLGGQAGRTFGPTMIDVSRLRVVFSASGSLVTANLGGGGGCPLVIDFDTSIAGSPLGLPSGTILDDQLDGVTISVTNNDANHPNLGLLFDTASRTGGDVDLKTPGGGIGNTLAQNLVLVISEDGLDADGDGLVDNPDDERRGGTISLVFDADVTFIAGSVLDIDTDETASFEGFSAAGTSMGVFPLASLGDNSFQRLEVNLDGVRRIELRLSGSGALTSLEYCDDLPVTADFDGTPRSGVAPLAVAFSDLSSGGPTAWSWDFGDGASSSAQNPNHTYAAVGSYTVSLTASNAGGSSTESKVDYIVVGSPPLVTDFIGSPLSGTVPLLVVFRDLSTGGPTSWSWDFGDGGSAVLQNVNHTYSSAGTYTVSLTATGPGGMDTETKVNYITVTAPPAVNADFSADVTSGTSTLRVDFTDLSSGNPTSWSWNFGDNTTSTLQNPQDHDYTQDGCYTVSLTASGAGGTDTETKLMYIQVGVDFAAVYPEFQVISGGSSCTNCHNTGAPAGSLDLMGSGTTMVDDVYASLVDFPALSSSSTTNCGFIDRVEPCDLNASVLYQSVISNGCRSQMFNISPNLESLLKSWIEGGARR